jgi:hypothetical protein
VGIANEYDISSGTYLVCVGVGGLVPIAVLAWLVKMAAGNGCAQVGQARLALSIVAGVVVGLCHGIWFVRLPHSNDGGDDGAAIWSKRIASVDLISGL